MQPTTIVPTLLAFMSSVRTSTEDDNHCIEVANGGKWGYMAKDLEHFLNKQPATAFQLKVDRYPLFDAKAVCGIRLCNTIQDNPVSCITSVVGNCGTWGPVHECPKNETLTSFCLRVMPPQGFSGDDTAVNNIIFYCSRGTKLEGDGLHDGAYGHCSQRCPTGICSMKTKVEGFTLGDNSALNDAVFCCC